MHLLALLLRRSSGAVALAVLCGLISGASSAGLIALINTILASGGTSGVQLILAFAGIGTLMLGARICSQLLLNLLQTRTTFELRNELSRRILATPFRRLEELGAHRLMATLVDDIQSLTQALLCVPVVLLNACIVLGCLVYLAVLSRLVFLALLVFAGLGIMSYWVPTSRSMQKQSQARAKSDRLFGDLHSLTNGLKELLLHRQRREAFLSEQLIPTATDLRALHVRVLTIHTLVTSWGMSLFFLFIGLLLFALPGVAPVSQQTLVGYTLAALYLQQPLESVMTLLPSVGQGIVALNQIERLSLGGSDAHGETLPSGALETPTSLSRIEFKGVTHSYQREGEDTRFTLGPVDLVLHPGELLFVVGGNGSGKTTLAKLITGLYVPESGEIWLDGRRVLDADRERYRQLFATVFSDFHLFDSLLGLATGDMEQRAREYLEKFQLARKVSIDARGALSTTELSSGQRKRLALLTAYFENRPVYLFDEWAADQDPTFKELFYRKLLPDLRAAGKAVVVISHDERYFDVADRIVRLESGVVIADERVSARRAPATS